MKEIVSENFTDARLPQGWSATTPAGDNYAFGRGALEVKGHATLSIPLGDGAWHSLRVEMAVEFDPGAQIRCSDADFRGITLNLAGTPYPRHQVSKQQHLLGESTACIPEKTGRRSIVFEFEQGRLRALVDGAEAVSAADPFPKPLSGWILLDMWAIGQIHSVCITGDDPCRGLLDDVPPRRQDDFSLEVNVDFFDDLINAPFNRKMFDELFAEFKTWGVRRCHWIDYGPMANGWWDHCPLGVAENFAKTFQNVGEILPAAVRAAHAHGIEIFGMFKPFDLGLHRSFGEGTPEAKAKGRLQRIGGPIGWVANFPAENREFMTCRKPGAYGPAENDVFTRIDLVKEDDRACAFTAGDLELYVSDDNASYRLYEGPMHRHEAIEDYPVYEHTASGGRKTSLVRRARVMRLDGLCIDHPYLALCAPGSDRSFMNTLINLVHVFGKKGEERRLTFGIQSRIRQKPDDKEPPFARSGIEFDHWPDTPSAVFPGYDVIASPVALDNNYRGLAVARGKAAGPMAILSPSFFETRQWWLSVLGGMLDAGVDGIELRVRNHHSEVAWGEFGFEQPVLEEFKRRHGVDLLATDDFDRAAFRRLRGEAYTQFYRETKQLCRSRGKPMGLHVSVTMNMEPEEGAAMGIHWDWRTWLKEGLADSVTMKEVRPGSRFAQEILSLTRPQGIPAIWCPYNSNWGGPGNVALVENRIRTAIEGGCDGFQLYECAAVVKGTPGGHIVMQQPALRDIFRKYFR